MTRVAKLALEDGSVYAGRAFGAEGERQGEVVFNTAMAGYQEILTDPSYKGQIVTMTYPHIGNYGVNPDDVESRRPFASGFVMRELSSIASNFRSRMGLGDYLAQQGVVAIDGIDTRAVTERLRTRGALKGGISTTEHDPQRLVARVQTSPSLIGRDLAKEVTCDAPYDWKTGTWDAPVLAARFRVTVLDYGVKQNILRSLVSLGCAVRVLPGGASTEDVLATKPEGIILSNGPGDPEAVTYGIKTIQGLVRQPKPLPIFGICLGHQLLGLALGGKTYKLKFGHHGGNHPVQDLATGKVEITAQNHGFAVDVESIPGGQVVLTHLNLNDKTVEGMRHATLPLFSVQYHPEASPGPHDAHALFTRFIGLMEPTARRR